MNIGEIRDLDAISWAELLHRILQCIKNHNFIEARQLLDEYKKRYQS